jgi:HAD superfamily hydrolase (TIGR01484 family)
MTRHETFDMHPISKKDLVLATDLDGTFLGGSDAAREKFYAWIEANRDRIGLIFVTGRDPGHISYLTRKQGVPRPDYAVADVGTTIAEVDADHYLRPIDALEAEIASSWNNANGIVEARLSRIRGLKLQSSGFRHRVSYDMDPEQFDRTALDIIAELGHDALISDNRFFDVLPKGVSKGPSLLRLLAHLGVENGKCLVAGDTLNDLSMLTLGLPAVAVGNSEPALIERVADLDHVHKAKEPGVVGIAEAIMALGLLKAA